MITRSSSPSSNDSDISAAVPSALPDASGPAHHDPVGGLVHAAVADRPVEEVAHLITLLEHSPDHARATLEALRAVGVDRSVEDVTQLVDLLTRPPRTAQSADETIRAAAERRPLDDVTRLVALLHQADLEPHCGREAVRAAATGRPVEELVELIRRLSEPDEPDKPDGPDEDSGAPADSADREEPAGTGTSRSGAENGRPEPSEPAAEGRAARTLTARRTAPPSSWPGRLAVAALVLCAVAHFPLYRDGASLRVYALTLGMSVACLAWALLLTLRVDAVVLAGAALLPGALAAVRLFDGRLPSAGLSRALDLTLAPAWAAGPVAVGACLVALAALLTHLASQSRSGGSAPDPEPAVAGRRTE
ncbi:hypothetical protein [Streptomyces sp. NPDC048002]|uniref:hypothetical protein n=1 Tax=Streptomyces sp. NPDC048002 TaxID=3154344 RepID=UPI0033BFF1C5